MKKALFCLLMLIPVAAFSQDNDIRNFLPGEHYLSYDKINGIQGVIRITFTDEPNIYSVSGTIQNKENSDFLKIEGSAQIISDLQFIIDCVMEIRISSLNEGKTCMRNGIFTFVADPARKNWEMSEENNPCYSDKDEITISIAEITR